MFRLPEDSLAEQGLDERHVFICLTGGVTTAVVSEKGLGAYLWQIHFSHHCIERIISFEEVP